MVDVTMADPLLSCRVRRLCGLWSWGTQAEPAAGSRTLSLSDSCCNWAEDIDILSICRYCPARTGNYKGVAGIIRRHNAEDILRPGWVPAMVQRLDDVVSLNNRFFRWFDSGDIRTVREAKLIYSVMAKTLWIRHWLPTRAWHSKFIRPILDKMNRLPNVVCRSSSKRLNTRPPVGNYRSIVYTDPRSVPAMATPCRAFANGGDGRCHDCRQCWSKSNKTIAYPLEGKKAAEKFGTIRKRLVA